MEFLLANQLLRLTAQGAEGLQGRIVNAFELLISFLPTHMDRDSRSITRDTVAARRVASQDRIRQMRRRKKEDEDV